MTAGKKTLGINTQLVHAGELGAPPYGKPVTTPIYASATFTYDSMAEVDQVFAGERQGYVYTRYGNPTVAALEEAVARNRQVDQATVAEVVERIRQLPAAKRLRATIQLAALLTTDERFQLVKQLLADLPEDVHHRLAERLRG